MFGRMTRIRDEIESKNVFNAAPRLELLTIKLLFNFSTEKNPSGGNYLSPTPLQQFLDKLKGGQVTIF